MRPRTKLVLNDNWYILRSEYSYDLKEIKKVEKPRKDGAKTYEANHGYFGKLSQAIEKFIDLQVAHLGDISPREFLEEYKKVAREVVKVYNNKER